MNFLSLEYFLEIAKTGNISTVAKELYISQQTLSEHISKLESELGTVLFKRTRPMQLTVTGKRLYEGAQEILAARNKTIMDIRNLEGSQRTTINVGEASFFNSLFTSDLIKRFFLQYPYHEVVVKTIDVDTISSNSEIDLFFLDMPGDVSLEIVPLTDNDMYMVLVQQKLLDEIYGDAWPEIERELIETKDLFLLRELPYILTTSMRSHNSKALEKAFEYANFRPKVVFRSERNGLNFEMSLNGTGALFAPMWMCKTILATRPEPMDQMRMFPIMIQDCPATGLGIGYHKGKKLNVAELQFIEITKDFIQELMA